MKTISPGALKKRLDAQEVVLIDVRQAEEYAHEHIAGSALMPLSEMQSAVLSATKKPIVVYCMSGQRSARAWAQLAAEDPQMDVASLEGGIMAWQKAGYKIVSSGTSAMAIQRQVHIVAGGVILLGTALGAVVHRGFYLVPGCMGLGLLIAGITGWCGLAKLLSKMPWNT